jgi:cysteine desulfurase
LRNAFIVPVKPIYLDHHATTPVDPRVFAASIPYFLEDFGNPSSLSHEFGRRARDAVERARKSVAELINAADPREIVFTSGATEACNLAIKGILAPNNQRIDHIITSAIEHRAVLDPIERLAREGVQATILKPDSLGMIDPERIEEAIDDRPTLVAIMAANNEIGVLSAIERIGRICRARGALYFVDAAQAGGKIPLDVQACGIDLLALSAHKFYGPKGIGASYVRREVRRRLRPILDGGGQEGGLRAGTVAVPLVVGMGEAAAIANRETAEESARIARLRDRLESGLAERIPDLRRNGHPTERLAGNLSVSFPGIDGDALLLALRTIAVSSGAACHSADPRPSHVLRAIGLDDDLARATLRFGIGRFNTQEDIDCTIEEVARVVLELRRRRGIGLG